MLREKFTEDLIYSQVFSFDVLDYFDSIVTEENVDWIVKYFDILMKSENEYSTKFRKHHIIPCLVFKDKNHTNRKETQPLADMIENNMIKLSISNHIKAHHCLWKIISNWDSKHAVQQLCKMENVEDLTDEELNEIARIEEECAKENQTEEERLEYRKNYYATNREIALKKADKWAKEHSEQNKKNKDEWYQRNKNDILQKRKDNRPKYSEKERKYRHNHKDKVKERLNRPCLDPIRKDVCTWGILKHRKSRNKELYEDIKLANCLIKDLMVIP